MRGDTGRRAERRQPAAGHVVVPDTNIFVSAAIAGGIPAVILRLGRQGRLRIATSAAIIDELRRVLREKFGYADADLHDIEDDLAEYAFWVTPRETLAVFRGKEKADNRILEAAVAARADAVVSGDHHLLSLRTFRGIPILTPRQFLDRFTRRVV